MHPILRKILTPESKKSGFVSVTITRRDLEDFFDYIDKRFVKNAQTMSALSPESVTAAEIMWYALLGSMAISAIGSVFSLHKLRDSVRSAIEKVRQQRFYGGIPKEEWIGVVKEVKQAQQSVTLPLPVALTAEGIEYVSGYMPIQSLRHVAGFTMTGLLVWLGSWVGGKIGDLITNSKLTAEVSEDVAAAKKRMLASLKRLIKAKMPEPFDSAVSTDDSPAKPEVGVTLTKTASSGVLWQIISAVPPAFVYGLYGLGVVAALLTYRAFEQASPHSPDPEQAAVGKALSILSGSPYPVEIDPDEFQQIFQHKTVEQSAGRPAIPYGLAKEGPKRTNEKRTIHFLS